MARILIAEDEPAIASFLERGLIAAGHTTIAVADGREAAAIARDDAFDLLLALDWRLEDIREEVEFMALKTRIEQDIEQSLLEVRSEALASL